MSRPFVLSNGNLHVGVNANGLVHDFYYPYVGLENHSAGEGTRHKLGVWVDGQISWLDDPAWQKTFQSADYALVGHISAKNDRLGLLLEVDSFVASSVDAFCRTIRVINLTDQPREVRVFFHQAFIIADSRSNRDTAQYLPDSSAVMHYHGNRVFVASTKQANGAGFDQHSIGLFGIEGREGTYRDADDGELGCGGVEHGRVDSTLRVKLHVNPHDSTQTDYWIACGTSIRDALSVHKHIQENGVGRHQELTALWWHKWLEPTFAASRTLTGQRKRQFIKSAMVIKSHIDNRGAIIASTDTTMLNYSRDAYAYCWPRDGAFVLWPLIRIGYTDEVVKFFDFCKDALHPNGYLMHKYQADGSLGSSWHPYVHGDVQAPPIQEDETALVLFMLAQFIQKTNDTSYLKQYYSSLVVPMAEFMTGYIDDTHGLPRPSYDLWEENFLTSTYTTAVVYGGLCAASDLAELMGDGNNAVKWKSAAEDIKTNARKYLFNTERGGFYKGIAPDGTPDQTLDISSFYGAYMFGLYSPTDDEVTRAETTLRSVFGPTDDTPLLPRYEHDNYQRRDEDSLGNFWFITSLWLGQYAFEVGNGVYTESVLSWVERHASETGMLAEQIVQSTLDPISVSPLIWSHAEYMATVLDVNGGDNATAS